MAIPGTVCQAGQGSSYTAHTDGISWLPPAKLPFCQVHTHLPSLTLSHTFPLPLLCCPARQPEGSVAGSTHTGCVQALLQGPKPLTPTPCTPVWAQQQLCLWLLSYTLGTGTCFTATAFPQLSGVPSASIQSFSHFCLLAGWAVSYSHGIATSCPLQKALPCLCLHSPPGCHRHFSVHLAHTTHAHLFLSFGSVSYCYRV